MTVERAAHRLAELRAQVLLGEVDGGRQLTLGEEALAEKWGQHRQHARVGKEDIIFGHEPSLRLKLLMLLLELGDTDHLGAKAGRGELVLELALRVLGEKADLGCLERRVWMRQRQRHRLARRRLAHRLGHLLCREQHVHGRLSVDAVEHRCATLALNVRDQSTHGAVHLGHVERGLLDLGCFKCTFARGCDGRGGRAARR
mmetsp:Transcript_20148/g.51302  ORF Transcript_20148/g.51302 Transcript_20148/m.51302 type:complete len:201 (-) Transcript_20148:326-928(-)